MYKSTLGLIDVRDCLANSCSLGLLQVYEMDLMALVGGIKEPRSEKAVPEVLLSVAKKFMILIREHRSNIVNNSGSLKLYELYLPYIDIVNLIKALQMDWEAMCQ